MTRYLTVVIGVYVIAGTFAVPVVIIAYLMHIRVPARTIAAMVGWGAAGLLAAIYVIELLKEYA